MHVLGYFRGLCSVFKPSPVPSLQNKGAKPSIQAEGEAKFRWVFVSLRFFSCDSVVASFQLEHPAGNCAELPVVGSWMGMGWGWDGDRMGIRMGMGMRCWDSWGRAAGPWLGLQSPGTAEIGSVVLSAYVEERTGCFKQGALILPCLCSLPKFSWSREWEYRVSSCHLSQGIFKPAHQCKSEEQ